MSGTANYDQAGTMLPHTGRARRGLSYLTELRADAG